MPSKVWLLQIVTLDTSQPKANVRLKLAGGCENPMHPIHYASWLSPDDVHEEEAMVVYVLQQIVLAALKGLLCKQQHVQGLAELLLQCEEDHCTRSLGAAECVSAKHLPPVVPATCCIV